MLDDGHHFCNEIARGDGELCPPNGHTKAQEGHNKWRRNNKWLFNLN